MFDRNVATCVPAKPACLPRVVQRFGAMPRELYIRRPVASRLTNAEAYNPLRSP